MKRFILTAVFLCFGLVSFAQEGFGIMGGVISSNAQLQDFDFDNVTQFRAGVAYKYPIAMGFAVQPEFAYSVKAATAAVDAAELANFRVKMGYLEAALQLQWGPDLLLLRPYVLVEPFVGYALNDRISFTMKDGPQWDAKDDYWDSIDRLEYGYAIGGGLELFGKVQVSAKHFVNSGSLYKEHFVGPSRRGFRKEGVRQRKPFLRLGNQFSIFLLDET